MNSCYFDAVKDALYPKRKGVISQKNKYLKTITPSPMTGEDVKKLRRKLSLSVSVFASLLNVSPKTVEAWEAGSNKVSGVALRLLTMIKNNPDIIFEGGAMEDKTALR